MQINGPLDGTFFVMEFISIYIYIARRPKGALLFWFFGDFRCGVSLLIVILVSEDLPTQSYS